MIIAIKIHRKFAVSSFLGGKLHLIRRCEGVCDTPLQLFNYNQMDIPKTKNRNPFINPEVIIEQVYGRIAYTLHGGEYALVRRN